MQGENNSIPGKTKIPSKEGMYLCKAFVFLIHFSSDGRLRFSKGWNIGSDLNGLFDLILAFVFFSD